VKGGVGARRGRLPRALLGLCPQQLLSGRGRGIVARHRGVRAGISSLGALALAWGARAGCHILGASWERAQGVGWGQLPWALLNAQGKRTGRCSSVPEWVGQGKGPGDPQPVIGGGGGRTGAALGSSRVMNRGGEKQKSPGNLVVGSGVPGGAGQPRGRGWGTGQPQSSVGQGNVLSRVTP